MRTLGNPSPQMLEIALIAIPSLCTRWLTCMHAAVPAMFKLPQSVFPVELADSSHSCIPRLVPVPFVESASGPEIGDVDEHMHGIALRAVAPAAFLVEDVHRFMGRISPLKVLSRIREASFRRELTTVDIALVRQESENLVISEHGLGST